ncbi:hypothetical protein A3SI_17884 [Nitritalea halalkaliphila LW7]|uniref:Uncharacterized protein n=1 Tax=Nitritalea halalkaliphila LW7 TaxID=1189621 RepID=I5BV42_9BACT|nr:hypothetical protein [Nitritalea halalkaliphila]EIM73444.1 hypothetical protein A3SI_17884 [Nitritalea halalkaliphila LW7]
MGQKLARYFKRSFEDYEVWVKVEEAQWAGTELIVHPDGLVERTELTFDEEIYEDLAEDAFEEASALAFQLLEAKSVPAREE